jgi:leucyl-tRNA synthetase
VIPSGGEVDAECFTGEGIAVNSPGWDGLSTAEAKERAINILTENGWGEAKTTYRLRDWLFSRQRYWGEPFPVFHHKDGHLSRVPDKALPVELPDLIDFSPSDDGAPPLSRAIDWVETTHPDTGEEVRRNTDTMPGWAGSCWYYLRFMDPMNAEAPFGNDAVDYWQSVDLYIGGTEHAVLHLLYARFWHKVLYDLGLVPTIEPFQKLFNQGMLTAYAFKDTTGRLVPSDEVDDEADSPCLKETGEKVERVIAKMSKSLKNVVNPDDVCRQFGVDTFRLYEMFMGPLSESKPWNPRDVSGCRRFLDRTWRLLVDVDGEMPVRENLMTGDPDIIEGDTLRLERALNQCLKRVDDSFNQFNFNTAVAAFMSFVNEATKSPDALTSSQATRFITALSPFAPHLAEELWSRLGQSDSITCEKWPEYEEKYLEVDEIKLVVQVMGKMRAMVEIGKEADKAQLIEAATTAAAKWIEGKEVVRTIVVPGKLVNFVVR